MTRSRRRLLVAGLASVGVALGASDVLLISGHAAQDDTQASNYSLFNGQVKAGADREQVFTSTNPGFDQGAVNNFYPLARVSVTTAGNSADASPLDTGPLFQAVAAGQNFTQPQYVHAQFPGTQNPLPYNAGPASASASVTAASGIASATYGAVGNTATAPAGNPSDGSDGGTARATAYFDSAQGFVTVGDSRIHHASYGGGMLVIDNLRVLVQVSSNGMGAFTKSVAVTVGSAYVNIGGNQIPVTIDQNGVMVAGQPGPPDQIQMVSATLNGAMANAGISVHAVAPVVTQQGDNLHVDAEGVVVEVRQLQSVAGQSLTTVPVAGGVPQQWVRHTLGVVSLDNEAVSAPTQPDQGAATFTDLSGGDTGQGSSTTIVTNPGASTLAPAPAAPATAPSTGAKRPAAVPITAVFTSKPMPAAPLVLGYLAWQALMIALAGALFLHRSAQRSLR